MKPIAGAVVGLLLCAVRIQAVNIDLVTVGNPGNAGELSGKGAGGYGIDRICGAVGYAYQMGKFEVTAAQYTEFLNAVAKADAYGLYNINMWSDSYGCKIQQSGVSGNYAYSVAADWANRPVNFISWGDAARFTNWLANGQPTGPQNTSTTEDGSYCLNGAVTNAQLMAVTRKANATWVIPSEDEWYKAAYYDPARPSDAGYWDYPTRNDAMPSNVLDPNGTNNANYHDYSGIGNGGSTIGSPYYRTEVGAFANSSSAYGTFDQGGNIWEWNETIVYIDTLYPEHGLRGASFDSYGHGLHAACRDDYHTDYEFYYRYFGFRVAYVPEPATLGLLVLASFRFFPRKRA